MRIIETAVYKFDELSEQAQQKVIENWRTDEQHPWSDENRESLEAFCNLFPIKSTDWEYGYRNYINSRFTGDSDHEELSGIRLQRYLVNNYWRDLFKGKYYSINLRENGTYSFKSRHSRCQFESSCPFTGYFMDDVILQPIIQYMLDPRKTGSFWQQTNFADLLHDCLQAWLKGCQDDYENWLSEEYIREEIFANDYEFTEDGKLV